MATIEITWTMAAAVTGWAITAVGLIKVYWRKSIDWDHAEKHHKILLGDPDKFDLGLVHRVHNLEMSQVTDARVKVLESAVAQVHILSKALNAYGSDEAAIVKAIHTKISEISTVEEDEGSDPFPSKSPIPKKR